MCEQSIYGEDTSFRREYMSGLTFVDKRYEGNLKKNFLATVQEMTVIINRSKCYILYVEE